MSTMSREVQSLLDGLAKVGFLGGAFGEGISFLDQESKCEQASR